MPETTPAAEWSRSLGGTGLTVSAITLGASPLAHRLSDEGRQEALSLIEETLRSPITVIDTANGYGDGESERRIGSVLAQTGGLPEGRFVFTKVDPRGDDYSGDRVRASVDESRSRLGLDTLPLVHLHDPEVARFDDMTAPGGAVDALVALKREGVIGSIGLAGGPIPLMQQYLALGVFDVLLIHNRWTLIDRSAGPILDQAQGEGVGVMNAAVFGGGILIDPGRDTYAYRPLTAARKQAIDALDALCQEWGTTLPVAALQFSLRDPRFASTIVGMSRPSRLPEILDQVDRQLPDEFWAAAEQLVPASDAWLEPPAEGQ